MSRDRKSPSSTGSRIDAEGNPPPRLADPTWTARRRALVLLFSDVADPLSVARQRAALAAGARQHRILFAGLDDPSLRAAVEGRVAAPAAVRASAWQLVAEREKGLAELRGAGVRVLDTLPAEAAAPLLAAWLEARRGM